MEKHVLPSTTQIAVQSSTERELRLGECPQTATDYTPSCIRQYNVRYKSLEQQHTSITHPMQQTQKHSPEA
jgi:hypothetical protein